MTGRLGLLAWLLPVALACRKVPLHDVGASFALADASWFEEEQTLFVFYEVTAEQGLGEPSVIEITYATDDERVDWTPLTELPQVHTHLPVDCGTEALCGSASLKVLLEPREVGVRLRYHWDGDLALEAPTVFNVVRLGPASHRSLIVYGVFDETNQLVQWRGRHQFPTLRNQEAEAMGLRRTFVVRDPRFGNDLLATESNPYGYGVTCPSTFVATGLGEVQTNERAVFHPDLLPLDASDASTVCAEATVTGATRSFTTGAVARKNPEVRPAFPELRSPIRDATQLPFFLGPCDRTISAEHEAMLRQRLLLGDLPTTCTDDWDRPGFVEGLVEAFQDAVEAERPAGQDMVLVVAVSQDDVGVSEAVEEALAQVVPEERHRSSPRLAGAFVLDSTARVLSLPELSPVTLWCPATIDASDVSLSCAIAPDNPDVDLGPFTFGTLPILPSREQYLEFIGTYSEQQAGSVQSLAFRSPEFATTSEHVDLGDYGVVTFLNEESISADANDAFSYCVGDDPEFVVFRSDLLVGVGMEDCHELGLPADLCEYGLLTLDWLPEWHHVFGESAYQLGVFWEFPYLLRVEYEAFQAGTVTAFGLSVPFGVGSAQESYYGTVVWTQETFPLDELLTQCDRFCGHPTFDSAGVYHVTDSFRGSYAHTCYLPVYPKPGDSGFPLDP
jgi:hypothetical protein